MRRYKAEGHERDCCDKKCIKGIMSQDLKTSQLLECLQDKKSDIYHMTQIAFTYHSNHIEGNQLNYNQIQSMFETNTISIKEQLIKIDDIREAMNHFQCIDTIIKQVNTELTTTFIKELHAILKSATSQYSQQGLKPGEYKKWANEVGGRMTVLPEDVPQRMKALLQEYHGKENKSFDDILDFHVKFERIHPFQDGNGRVGRLIMFKECLKYGIVPFIIEDDLKMFYYRGLNEWGHERGYLRDTCLSAQDQYKAYLDYFRIPY